MAENFWFKFYFKDWLHDTKLLSTEEKGLLLELIIYMRDHNGECPVEFRLANRLTEITTNFFQLAIKSFRENSILDFEMRGETEFMISRKIKKEAIRSLIYTENGKKGGNPKLKKNRLTKLDKQRDNLKPNSIFNSNSNLKNKGAKPKKTNYPDDFEKFWNAYDKKTGAKPKALAEWEKLDNEDREKAMNSIPAYKIYKPDAQFRKDPERYFRDRIFENEFPKPMPNGQPAQPLMEAPKSLYQ